MTKLTTATDTSIHVANWPSATALLTDTKTTLTVAGAVHTYAGTNIDQLRSTIIAHVVTIASKVRRPVRLSVTGSTPTPLTLAIHPGGEVTAIDSMGKTPSPVDQLPYFGPCARCTEKISVTETTCPGCNTVNPHGIKSNLPSLEDLENTAPRPSAASFALTFFDGSPAIPLTHNYAIGRDPDAIANRTTLKLESPQRTMSRTHALLDITAAGLTITDYNSSNGTELNNQRIEPMTPMPITTTTTVVMGDVKCKIISA